MALESIVRMLFFSFSIAGVFFLCWVFVALLCDTGHKRPSAFRDDVESRRSSTSGPKDRYLDQD